MKHSRVSLLESRGQGTLGFSVSEMTRVPASDWVAPRVAELPDRLHGLVGVDTETEDRGLNADQGAGWAWNGGGRVVGYSISADNWRGYIPLGHPEGNVDDPVKARAWLNHVLGGDNTKLFAHAMYDVGWAETDGVKILGPVVDVQWAEALLDEHRMSYSLEAIAADRIGEKKDEALLTEAAVAYGLGATKRDVKRNLHKLPARFIGPYAEWDAEAPRRIWAEQDALIKKEKLERVLDLEHSLLPMYLDMRRRGVRIDVARAEALREDLEKRVVALVAEIKRLTGREVEIWAAKSIAPVLDDIGVRYPLTPASREPSITQEVLEKAQHPVTKLIREARELDKLRGTFVDGQVLGAMHEGRVHGSINPLKSDDGEGGKRRGTVTGRISMDNPNLQFIPIRTDMGKKIRELFVPEDGEKWASADFGQQEPKLLVHYGCLVKMPSAMAARDKYLADPKMNYHEFVSGLTGLNYKSAKILNMAIIYGRGIKETSIELGKSQDETKALFRKHAEKMPFARAMSYRCQDAVRERGYITSLSGRRMRFPLWEPDDWDLRDGRMLKLEEAQRAWPGQPLGRARIHKALNSLIQPSAADQTKTAMRRVWDAGYGKHILMQVHDELGASVPDPKIADDIAELMRDAVKLVVPVVVDVEIGDNWGECG